MNGKVDGARARGAQACATGAGDGDHGAWFLDVKRAGFKVGYVPGVFISQQSGRDSERYQQFRRRANNPERSCFVKRGITKYVLGNGHVDYEKEKQ